jgi:hypothetical protein
MQSWRWRTSRHELIAVHAAVSPTFFATASCRSSQRQSLSRADAA